jgi:hypothetical protein
VLVHREPCAVSEHWDPMWGESILAPLSLICSTTARIMGAEAPSGLQATKSTDEAAHGPLAPPSLASPAQFWRQGLLAPEPSFKWLRMSAKRH